MFVTERSKKIHDRINSEEAENTAMIIGIVAGALIAVILVIILVLKLKTNPNTTYKVEERKNFVKAPPSHSNSNAALLNTTAAGLKTTPPMPALGNIEKKSPPSKKSGKDIKEWYV